MNENLNELSKLIENEIHSTHSISDKLWSRIRQTVESVPHILEAWDIRDKQLKSVMNLNAVSFKLFQYLVAALDSVFPEAKDRTIYHVSNVMLTKAFKFFPDNTEIFLAYCVRRVLNDRDEFIKQCFKDKIINVENKSTVAGNLLAWLMLLVIIAFIIVVFYKLSDENNHLKRLKKYKKMMKKQMKKMKNKLLM